MLKRKSQKMIRALSNEEFEAILELLNLPMSALVTFLSENKNCSQRVRLVVQELIKDFRKGGFHMLGAIWDRLPPK